MRCENAYKLTRAQGMPLCCVVELEREREKEGRYERGGEEGLRGKREKEIGEEGHLVHVCWLYCVNELSVFCGQRSAFLA